MARYTYGGDQPVTFSFYLDVTDPQNVTTLVAEPGNTYDIKQADGHTAPTVDGQVTDMPLPMPPDKDWTPEVEAKPAAAKKKETG